MVAPREQFLKKLAVCSWSLQPENPEQLAEKLKEIGLSHVQLDMDPFREKAAVWSKAPDVFAKNNITPVSGMFRTVGEDYSTLETIRVTGGLVPDKTWEQNLANAKETVKNAKKLNLKFVMFHAGFLPHDPKDPNFEKLSGRLRQVARLFAAEGITLGCETGQESATGLKAFLDHLNEPNVAINFDPANMLLYGNGDPIEALKILGKRVQSVHVKDGIKARTPGTWGEEVRVGTGQVNWPAFFTTLAEINFPGWLCLEREADNKRVEDIRAGKVFVEKLLKG
ncbi:MAG TPA: sugar phosphate isomerase/epimerase family protein [Planctomycetota bacterium]|jgi:sugar phosphate isomerase/epimerase